MTIDDRLGFVKRHAAPGAVFAGLDDPSRERVAVAMTERMGDAARAAAAGGER